MLPLWLDPTESTFPPLEGRHHADIAIIGGGLTGMGAAHALQSTGAEVALLEARTVGSGASGRNGGFLTAGAASGYLSCLAGLGAGAAREVWQLSREAQQDLARLIEEHEIDCGYLRRGSMALAASETECDYLQRTASALHGEGISCCLVPPTDLPVPFDRLYQGGLYIAGDAELNSGALVRGVAATLGSSVKVYEDSRVEDMEYREAWYLRTAGGTVAAKAVILATNAWTGRLVSGVPIVPRRGQVVATAALDRVMVPFPMHANEGYQYWRQTAGGHLVVGGWRDLDQEGETTMDEALNPSIQEALGEFVARVAGKSAHIAYRWAGIMGWTPDLFPLVGPVPNAPDLFIAAGYSGHGVPFAFACGAAVAQLAVGQPARVPLAFASGRFEAGYAG